MYLPKTFLFRGQNENKSLLRRNSQLETPMPSAYIAPAAEAI